jgi:23S rRNA (adenine2030-N6)-methyltransferase
MDPAWEEKDEYETIPAAASRALGRFPEGLYIIWYPLLAVPKAPGPGPAELLPGLFNGRRCRAELYTGSRDTRSARSPRGMYGSGLVIYNPPWTLRGALEETLPFLSAVLGNPGGWRVDWTEGNAVQPQV